jgi:hypothetical protein
MLTFIYQCPSTGQNVQGWIADEVSAADTEVFYPMTCLACRQLHLVNPPTGRTPQEGRNGVARGQHA